MNQITTQVWVLDGGNLTQYNIWGDDCFVTKAPYACFAALGPGGWLGNYGGEISDATCTDVQHSVPISTCLMFYKFTTFLRGGYHVQHLSERWAAALAAGCSPAGAAVQPPGRVP
jgi:hypothetical protein